MKYDIQVNPLNPVEYLACCGVFELLSRFDAKATSWWELEPQPRFWLESEIDEALLLRAITTTLSDWEQWQAKESSSGEVQQTEEDEASDEEIESEEGNEGIKLTPQFTLHDKQIRLHLDWWYETLSPLKKIKEKSAWKMYAGQQTAEKISRDMTTAATALLKQKSVTSLTELLKSSVGMTGRFGFDPRSSRNALDTGYSPNDLNLPIATHLFAEMLTGIAAQYFFPARTRPSKDITSSRGWVEKNLFQYALWQTRLPIALARMAAIGAGIDEQNVIPVAAGRANRDKYSNFKMATRTIWKANA